MVDGSTLHSGQIVRTRAGGEASPRHLLVEKEDKAWLAIPLQPHASLPSSRELLSLSAEDIEVVEGSLPEAAFAGIIKDLVLSWSRRYASIAHGSETHWIGNDDAFVPKENPVPYAGRVYNEEEIVRAVDVTLDFWLTLGKEGDALEKGLAKFLGVRKSILVNSGSSANLLAVSALTSHKLPREKRLCPGDEVITCASGFPTTVAPLIQNNLVPVFLDNDPVTLNPRMEDLEAAYREGKTKAVMFAHAMGNPFDLASVMAFCRKYDLWLIEDNCDSLGSLYAYPDENGLRTALTGSFGDISTQSFYPPHHLTMGEGGAVNIVRDMKLKLLVESFRDWGRDCWCPSGKDNTCNKRFGWQLGDLPVGYDHKYIYSHLGYNLKPLDIQAAIGNVQLQRMPSFIKARQDNWNYLRAGLDDLQSCFEFALPVHAEDWQGGEFVYADSEQRRAVPSWFGFLMLVRDSAGFSRPTFSKFLDEVKIGNRTLFGGNLVRQPALVQLARENSDAFRVIGNLSGSDKIMNKAIFIGVYPGLSRKMLDYIIEQIHVFCKPYL
ncbi:MAG: lipopolysaccharide biosynthesis protein RfbH [Puniceicoccaceae bacterium]